MAHRGAHDHDLADDDRLVEAVARGDEQAWSELYTRYSAYAWSVAYRRTQRACGADEVTQEVFVSVWQCSGRYDAGRGSMRIWLSVITRRRAADWLRHELAVHRRDLSAAQLEVTSQPAEDDAVVLRDQVLRALDQLPETERDPIVLAHFAGATYREAARELRIPEGTCKSRIRSGLGRLTEILGPQPAASAPDDVAAAAPSRTAAGDGRSKLEGRGARAARTGEARTQHPVA